MYPQLKQVQCVCLLLILLSAHGFGARILFVAFLASRSHVITYEPLLEALAARGHHVTYLSPAPLKNSAENIRQIQTMDLAQSMAAMPNMFEIKQQRKRWGILDMLPPMIANCQTSLELPHVRAVQQESYDLIFVPAILNECALAFASTFKTSVVIISPYGIPASVATFFGNPSPVSVVPNYYSDLTEQMGLMDRIENFVREFISRAEVHFYVKPAIEQIYHAHLGDDVPGIYDLIKNASLMLANSHLSISSVRPFLPDIVEVGGMHCTKAGPLPKDLEDFVSNSGNAGFILFSLGSVLKSAQIPLEKLKVMLNVFSKLKEKVIWKWDAENVQNVSDNVKLTSWVPQQDVLGHAKIRAFITHGGFGSTTEAVYHGVPIIGLPIFADQALNMKKAAASGYGILLDFNNFTEDTFSQAIHQVLEDPRYRTEAKKFSVIFRDQLNQPLERAIYWVEYVIRHGGAHHLRSAGRDLNFFEYHSIDVLAVISAVVLSIFFISTKILKLVGIGLAKLILRRANGIGGKRKLN